MPITAPMPNLDNHAFRFLNKQDYFNELINRLSKTKKGDRILMITHTLEANDPTIARMLDILSEAASRGANVDFAIDERSLPIMQKMPFNRSSQNRIASTYNTLSKLQSSGASYVITNKTYRRLINRFAGRSHIKLTLINDEIYIGGCNLSDISHIDMMVHWRDAKSATWLYQQMKDVITYKSTRQAFGDQDKIQVIDQRTMLLLDVGKPKQSIIYEKALSLIDDSKEWIVMSCQFFPSSLTAKHLAKAYKRGVDVSLYFNHPSKHKPGHNLLHHIVLLHERTHRPSNLFNHQLQKGLPFLHTKLLATEQGVMIGSHNYIAAGVNFGTAELTLLRYDNQFSKQAVKFFSQQLANYENLNNR